ncbi:hypothetical protein FRC20_009711 [Serendipita sp. 405]|nr:hypothetical protein FRC15_009844 [Serendipita sp. 397]KAG8797834.1 hypothetical protein FRC16_008493 [Serendipita sp. 398]KAG8865534.1 hypothetical protein FRC20_009711 [Serendipita sp. 405]
MRAFESGIQTLAKSGHTSQGADFANSNVDVTTIINRPPQYPLQVADSVCIEGRGENGTPSDRIHMLSKPEGTLEKSRYNRAVVSPMSVQTRTGWFRPHPSSYCPGPFPTVFIHHSGVLDQHIKKENRRVRSILYLGLSQVSNYKAYYDRVTKSRLTYNTPLIVS